MGRNRLKMIETLMEPEEWLDLCPDHEYRIVTSGNYPHFIPRDLAAKCPQALILCSGSDAGLTCWFLVARIDGDEIDIDPTIYVYTYATGKESSGTIFHGDWPDRTTTYPAGYLEEIVTASGFDQGFRVNQFPAAKSGSIQDLVDGGLAEGFRKPEQIFHEKRPRRADDNDE